MSKESEEKEQPPVNEFDVINLDDEAGAKQDRINQQCFLVDNYQQLAYPNHPYRDLTCMMGNPSDILQKLSARPGQNALLTMSSAKYAQLTPVIRIFKVPMDPLMKTIDENKKKQEILFSTTFNEKTVGWGGTNTVTAGYRGDQVGLKEMTYELDESGGGVTVGRSQQITLKFVADSMQALQRSNIIDLIVFPKATKSKYADKTDAEWSKEKGKAIWYTEELNSDFYALQIVFGWALPPGKTDVGGLSIDERKAISKSLTTLTINLQGHDIAFQQDGSVEITAEYIGYVDSKMGEVRSNILYSSGEHKAKRRQQTEAVRQQERKARYAKEQYDKKKANADKAIGRVDSDHDYLKGRGTDADNRSSKLNAAKTDELVGEDGDKGSSKSKAALRAERIREGAIGAYAEEDYKHGELKGKLEETIQKDRQQRYSRVLEDLIASGRTFFVDIDPRLIGRGGYGDGYINVQRRIGDGTELTEAQQEAYDDKRRGSKRTYGKETLKPGRHLAAAEDGGKAQLKKSVDQVKDHGKAKKKEAEMGQGERAMRSVGSVISLGYMDGPDEIASNQTKEFAGRNMANAPPGDRSKLRVYYIHWGDLLSSVLKSAYKGKKLPLRFLIGTINFKDPRTGSVRSMNLADVPISLNLFNVWWFEKVITPQLDVYTVKSFVVDSINELILAAMGADCWVGETNFGKVGDTSKSSITPPRVSYTSFSAPLGKGQKDRIPNKSRIGMDNDGIAAYNSNRKEGTDWSVPDNHVEYIFIYCSAWAKKKRSGNIKEDNRDGIYHLSIGNDEGPVKTINFEKDEELSDYQKTDAMSNEQGIDQLVSYYNAEVEMMGNTIWLPANYVYIAPSALGMSRRFAEDLGLGGYYTVIGMSGKLGSTGWSTTMKCQYLYKTGAAEIGFQGGGITPAGSTSSKSRNPEVKQK